MQHPACQIKNLHAISCGTGKCDGGGGRIWKDCHFFTPIVINTDCPGYFNTSCVIGRIRVNGMTDNP